MREWFWRFVCGRRGHKQTEGHVEVGDAIITVSTCACGLVGSTRPYHGQYPHKR
jgi:hypothetical protein